MKDDQAELRTCETIYGVKCTNLPCALLRIETNFHSQRAKPETPSGQTTPMHTSLE